MDTNESAKLVANSAGAPSRFLSAFWGTVFLALVACAPQEPQIAASPSQSQDLTPRSKSDEIIERVELLLRVPPAHRGVDWAGELDELLPHATYHVSNPIPKLHPPPFPYIEAALAPRGANAANFQQLVNRVTTAGAGLALVVDGKPTVHVSFGHLATYRMFQTWTCPDGWNGGAVPDGTETLTLEETVLVGAPNFEYFPEFIRLPIRKHLQAAGVPEPRVLLVLWPERGDHRDLAFNVLPSHFNPERYRDLQRSLTWFLPEGYRHISWDLVATSSESAAVL